MVNNENEINNFDNSVEDKTHSTNDIGQNEENHHRRKEFQEKNKSKITAIIILIGVIITIIIISCIYVLVIKFESNIFKNVYILNENVSGFSSKQLEKLLIDKNKLMTKNMLDVYENGKKIYTIYPSNIELEIDIGKTLKNAFSYGRNSNDILNAITVVKNINNVINVNVEYKYNESKFNELLKNLDLTVEGRYIDDSYTIDTLNNSLILIKGKKGNSIDYETVKKSIIKNISIQNNKYDLDIIQKNPNEIIYEKIYKDSNKEPKNAYVNEEEKKVVKEQNGYKLDDNVLKKAINDLKNKSANEEIIIKLETVEAEIKTTNLNYSHFNDKIEGITTYFNSAEKNRSNNIEVGVKYINEVIIQPGEIFSFNNTVGEITKAKGYLLATTFSGGKAVSGIGGGICQVSSTLYNAVLKSNLEIVTRYAHSLPVGYVLPSLDATIYVGVQDFKFRNNREFPIKIIATYNPAGSLNISIYGVKEEIEYTVELESKVIEVIYAKTKYVYDNTIEKGKEIIVSKGSNGKKSEAYIIRSLNGKVVSKELLSKDVYGAQDKIIKIGTKEN